LHADIAGNREFLDYLRNTKTFYDKNEGRERNLVPIDVPSGSNVFREGERGDRFFIIERGSAAITREGEFVVDRGPGDYFGEVALLNDQPRNATVTATSALRLLALERDEFLRVVTGHDVVGAHARRVADVRSTTDRET